MVAFDNTILSLLMLPDAEQHTGREARLVEHARERVLGLVQTLEAERERVVVPTPALAELLVTEGADADDILTTLGSSACLRIEGFDVKSAVELAVRLREARRTGDLRDGLAISKSEMKFDRQIVAIALVNGAKVLYSDDIGVAKFAANCGLTVKGVEDLPVPVTQQTLAFEEPGQTAHTVPESEIESSPTRPADDEGPVSDS